jgi:hypothetical protein
MSGAERHKATKKRTYPLWPAVAATLPSPLSSPPPPHDEDSRAAKMPRRMVPFPTTVEEGVTKTTLADAEEPTLPAHANINPMTSVQPTARAYRAPPSLSAIGSAIDLISAENHIIQMNHNRHRECRNEWSAVAAMAPVPVPTNMQLSGLSGRQPPTSIYPPTGLTGMSTADLINHLQLLNGMNGNASTVPQRLGQRTSPWWNGWRPQGGVSYPAIVQTTDPMGVRIANQGSILNSQHNDYNGPMLDPNPTTTGSCRKELSEAVDVPVDRTTGHASQSTSEEVDIDIDQTTKQKGKWTEEEDGKLIRAAEKFAVTRWKAIAALIPGRTKKQCWNRWQYALDPSIVRTTERTGRWLPEEDDKLVGAVEKHNGKNWDAIATLVPSRTKRQCMDRWHKVLDSSGC